jgi:hypothetical protein
MARNPDHYAIVVGIDAYPQLPKLRAAVADAARFGEWLLAEDGGGLLEDNLALIPSGEGPSPSEPFDARPVQEDIDRALRKFGVEDNTRIGRRLYFYFAGHGFGPSYDEVGMLMAHAAVVRLNNSIGLRKYRTFFRDYPLFDEVVFILDCCRDDQRRVTDTGSPAFTLTGWPGPPVQDFVVLAAAYGAKAFEPKGPDAKERGLLTQALLEGLGSAPAADRFGAVTASSLQTYLRQRVPQLAGASAVNQTPDVQLPTGEFTFRTGLPVATGYVLTRIFAPPGSTGQLILRNEDGAFRLRHDAAAATPWEVDLPANHLYSVEHTTDPADTSPAVIDLRHVTGSTHVVNLG